jgi:Ferritin-like domain
VTPPSLPRRDFLLQAMLLTGCTTVGPPPLPPASEEDDKAILNNLIALEYAAVAAYDGTRDLLSEPRRASAAQFRADHARHAEALVATLRQRGGEPVEPVPFRGIAADEAAALRLLAEEERGLAAAYIGAAPAFADRDLARAAGNILSVEMMHWSAWRAAMGAPPTDGPFFFDQKMGSLGAGAGRG